MYLLLNDQEVAGHVAHNILLRRIKKIAPEWRYTKKIIKKYQQIIISEHNREEVEKYISEDLDIWEKECRIFYKKHYSKLTNWLTSRLISNMSNQSMIDHCISNTRLSLVKSFGPQLLPAGQWATQIDLIPASTPTVIRNIYENEKILKEKLDNNYPFWFIDTGYTNFLHSNKKWHRVVVNHIHQTSHTISFPADRLSNLPTFPKPWRTGGNRILILPPSEYICRLYDIDSKEWCRTIRKCVNEYTDLIIEFRSKADKKIRTNLYEELQNPDYYCLINYSSAAAIEAIFAGLPVITYGRHISNSVSRSNVTSINNLYRGPIGEWLCALTYSQFTFDEMCNGVTRKILREYHNV